MWRRRQRAISGVVMVGGLCGACAVDAPPLSQPAAAVPLRVAVVYRGGAGERPDLNDLAAVRAYDFTALAWEGEVPVDEVRVLAASISLDVVEPVPAGAITPERAVAADPVVRISVRDSGGPVEALAWRALAHGARTVVFDAGAPAGAGFTGDDGRARPWVEKARAVARQLTFNSELVGALRPGPPVDWIDPRPDGLDVAVRQTDRSWLLIATNTSASPVRGVVRVATALPPALWVDLLDGTAMSMLNQPEGPRWTFDLGPDGARVYAIDK
jgi:hypothetical protein